MELQHALDGLRRLNHRDDNDSWWRCRAGLSPFTVLRHLKTLDLAMLGYCLERAVRQRHELVVIEDMGSFLPKHLQDFDGQLPNLDFGMAAAAQFEEVA